MHRSTPRRGFPTRCAVLLLLGATTTLCGGEFEPLRFALPAGTLDVPTAAPLFELWTNVDVEAAGARRLVPDDFAECERLVSGKDVTLRFRGAPRPWGGDVTVTVRFEPVPDEVLTRIEVDSSSYYPVQRVVYPNWKLPEGSDRDDPIEYDRWDTLLMPSTVGDAIQDAVHVLRGHFGRRFSLDYPARAAMQYIVYDKTARNFYLSAYSSGDETFAVTSVAEGNTLRLCLEWNPFLSSGRWESPPCAFSLLDGDWHAAADLYRSHMGSVFRPPELPEWMRDDFHGWVQVGLKGGNVDTWASFKRLPEIYDENVASAGLNVMHCFSWCEDGLDRHYPDRNPSPNLGTPEELAEAMDAIRSKGGHVILYVNGRTVDPDSDFYRRTGTGPLIMTADGGPRLEDWHISPSRVACPMADAYQEEQLAQFRKIITQYRAHACQIDQVACTSGFLCYNADHGHPTPATNFLPGLDAMLSRVHDLYRELDPDFFVWVEGMHERTAQFYEVSQSHGEGQGWSAGYSLPEQFRYTFPDMLCTGCADGFDALAHTFGQGKPFDFMRSRYRVPRFKETVRDLATVRRSERPYFLHGLFRDTVGVVATGEGIRFWRIDRRDAPGLCVNLWAQRRGLDDAARAWLRHPRPGWGPRLVYPADLAARAEGGWLELEWTGPIATIVFEPGTGTGVKP